VAHRRAVDADGAPIPWWTYAATRWLELALAGRSGIRSFEFGAGSSTAWLAARSSRHIAVEHDPVWYGRVARQVPEDVDLRLVPSDPSAHDPEAQAAYVAALSEGTFDLIVVDGIHRNACAATAIDHLADGGLVLLDDSDRTTYGPALRMLADAGFGRVDFFGPRPGVGHLSTTSLFSCDLDGWARDLGRPEPSGY
jgi:hypothetical protein